MKSLENRDKIGRNVANATRGLLQDGALHVQQVVQGAADRQLGDDTEHGHLAGDADELDEPFVPATRGPWRQACGAPQGVEVRHLLLELK